jgi:outer membrane protease
MALYRVCLPVIMAAQCLFLSSSVTVQAAQPVQQSSGDITFGIGIGYLNGNTLYHISSYDATGQGIESELEFPLKTFLFSIQGGYLSKDLKGRDEVKITLQWLTNIDNGSGQLKDSDWATDAVDIALVGAPHAGLDIFSTSDIKLKANILDLRASYNNWLSDTLSVGPLGGFLYQNFHFDASHLSQVGYGPYAPGYTGTIPGKVLTYDVTYIIPYLGIHSELQLSKQFHALVDLGYSPWVSAEDEDDHLLRYKRSNGSTTGTAYLAAVSARWDLQDDNSFLLQGQYLKIDTTGTQTQTWYRAPNSDGLPAGYTITGIHDKVTSQQTTITFLFNHRF